MALAAPAGPGSVRPNWKFQARQLAWAAVDAILTPACGGCGQPGQRLCPACRAAFRFLGAGVCATCGLPLQAGRGCGERLHPIAPLTGLRSAAFYEGPLRNAVLRLKYRQDIGLADSLARPLAEAWAAYGLPAGAVVPVPLSAARLRERGYNQAALLARGLADLTGLRPLAGAVARVRDTPSQVGLLAEERWRNMRGAFRARPERAAGRVIILVDDICTTGATLLSCAAALRAAGAAEIWGLTLGRAGLGGDGRPPVRPFSEPAPP
jgi:ComF family protein